MNNHNAHLKMSVATSTHTITQQPEELIPYVLRLKRREARSIMKKEKKEAKEEKSGVVWTEDTVDNEFLGKKSSKKCCIYHKPRAFDESSSESDYEKPEEQVYPDAPDVNR